MPNVGSQNTVVSGVNATLTLNGNLIVVARNFTAKWGNAINEEGVTGTDIPIILTEKFHGECDMEVMYSTENTGANEQFAKLMTPSNGQISAINLSWTGKDTGGPTTRTFTLTGTVWPKQTEWGVQGEKLVTAKISLIFSARPTLT